MIWSISGHKEFIRCQRQWFYGEKIASWNAKDPFRREVHLLSNLSSIDAWRGNIVDYVISNKIIPAIRWKNKLQKDSIISFAKKLARDRHDFAKNLVYRQEGVTKTSRIYDYAAIFDFEYQPTLDLKDRFIKAWQDIEQSLLNFLENVELIKYLRSAQTLVTQKTLFFKYNGVTIRGVPDLIAFFKDAPPHIFDWKVHVFGIKTFQEQLIIYALGLMRCEKKGDLPDISQYSICDIKLSEYQLLKNILRPYEISEEYVWDTEELIAESIERMEVLGASKKLSDLDIEDFEAARYPETCSTCCYQKICIGGQS